MSKYTLTVGEKYDAMSMITIGEKHNVSSAKKIRKFLFTDIQHRVSQTVSKVISVRKNFLSEVDPNTHYTLDSQTLNDINYTKI